MDVISIESGIGAATIKAAGVLRRGGILLYPTDTMYGLGAEAFADDTADRIYAIKGRDPKNPISCVVASLEMADEYVEVNDAARTIAAKFLPGAITLILPLRLHVTQGIARGLTSLGIRIPKSDFCLELARTYGRPFTTTSANRAGFETLRSPEGILTQLGEAGEMIDLVVNNGELPESAPSTVVNLVSGKPSILRKGAVDEKEIFALFPEITTPRAY